MIDDIIYLKVPDVNLDVQIVEVKYNRTPIRTRTMLILEKSESISILLLTPQLGIPTKCMSLSSNDSAATISKQPIWLRNLEELPVNII